MIEFGNIKEKELLIRYAKMANDLDSLKIIESGVNDSNEVAHLAKLYWSIVDSSADEDIEYLLEKVYTSLHIHCGNRGYSEVWDNEIP